MSKARAVGVSVLMALGLTLAWTMVAFAATPGDKPVGKPAGSMSQSVETTATVVSIDAKKRVAVLEGADGNTVSVNVKPDVKNLDKVKKGDLVRIQYNQTIDIEVRTAKTGASAAINTQTKVAEKGMPGKTQISTVEFTATVEAIDYKKREVTLKGPAGNEETYEVSKDAKKFDNVKIGDELNVKVTETLAVTVEKIDKK